MELFQMRKRAIGKTSEVDNVGSVGAHHPGAFDNLRGSHQRRVDDFGEDGNIILGEIDLLPGMAQIFGKVGNFFGAALEPGAKKIRQPIEIATKSTRHDDAVGASRKFQPAFDDIRRHQCGHLDADVGNHGFHLIAVEFLGDALYAWLRQRSGNEYDALGHVRQFLSKFGLIVSLH